VRNSAAYEHVYSTPDFRFVLQLGRLTERVLLSLWRAEQGERSDGPCTPETFL
jgi:hypothetical protein